MLRVAVVGSGPSGVYTAQALLNQSLVPDVRVHVLDRLPTPYGLVRYGVAPDHEKIKSLQNSLRAVLEDERVTFVGHVQIGGTGGVSRPGWRSCTTRSSTASGPRPTARWRCRARICRGATPPPGSSPGTARIRTSLPTASPFRPARRW